MAGDGAPPRAPRCRAPMLLRHHLAYPRHGSHPSRLLHARPAMIHSGGHSRMREPGEVVGRHRRRQPPVLQTAPRRLQAPPWIVQGEHRVAARRLRRWHRCYNRPSSLLHLASPAATSGRRRRCRRRHGPPSAVATRRAAMALAAASARRAVMGLPPSCCKAGRHGTPPLLQFTAGLLPSWRRLATKPWGSCYHCVGALRATKAQAGMLQRPLYFATFLLYCCYYSIYFLLPILRRGFPARSPATSPAMSPMRPLLLHWQIIFATIA
jgi:hypothetical protein